MILAAQEISSAPAASEQAVLSSLGALGCALPTEGGYPELLVHEDCTTLVGDAMGVAETVSNMDAASRAQLILRAVALHGTAIEQSALLEGQAGRVIPLAIPAALTWPKVIGTETQYLMAQARKAAGRAIATHPTEPQRLALLVAR